MQTVRNWLRGFGLLILVHLPARPHSHPIKHTGATLRYARELHALRENTNYQHEFDNRRWLMEGDAVYHADLKETEREFGWWLQRLIDDAYDTLGVDEETRYRLLSSVEHTGSFALVPA